VLAPQAVAVASGLLDLLILGGCYFLAFLEQSEQLADLLVLLLDVLLELREVLLDLSFVVLLLLQLFVGRSEFTCSLLQTRFQLIVLGENVGELLLHLLHLLLVAVILLAGVSYLVVLLLRLLPQPLELGLQRFDSFVLVVEHLILGGDGQVELLDLPLLLLQRLCALAQPLVVGLQLRVLLFQIEVLSFQGLLVAV